MKRSARLLQYMPLLLIAARLGAQDPAPTSMPDVYGNLNLAASPIPDSEGLSLQLDWPAVDGTYYFVEHTEDLMEGFGSIKLFAGSRANSEGKLGLGIQTSAKRNFYRLFVTDDESHPRLLADDDGDKISNLLEAKAGWDAYEQPADMTTDADPDGPDGLPDYWEQFHFGNLDQDGTGDADGDGVSNAREFSFGDNPGAEETERTAFQLEVEKIHDEYDFLGGGSVMLEKMVYLNDYKYEHSTGNTFRKEKLQFFVLDFLMDEETTEHNDWKNDNFFETYYNPYGSEKYPYADFGHILQGHYKLHSFSGTPLTLLVKHSEHEEIIEEDSLDKTTEPTGVVSYEVIRWDGESLTIDGDAVTLPTEERDCKYEYGEVELPYRVEFIAPAGGANNDPVENPIDGGDGSGEVPNNANEFTFSTATPGVLTISFKAKISGLELSKIVNDCIFTIENVGQAPTWAGANPGGKASISNGFLVATATFTGLPPNNSDFGKKKVKLLVDGSVAQEAEIEVFFPRDAKNHPGDGSGTTPNWFYYWSQLPEAHGHNLNYGGFHQYVHGEVTAMTNWSYQTAKDKSRILIYSGALTKGRAYGVGKLLSGVDYYIGTVIHEAKHIDQIAKADLLVSSGDSFRFGWSWNQTYHNHWSKGDDRNWGESGVDDDKDSIVDNAKALPPFEPGNGDDISLDHDSFSQWPKAWPLPSLNNGPHPIESEAINATDQNYSEHKNARNDWANPGKNHKTTNNWND